MKINIVSDLHLRQAPFALPDSDADLVILAGDVARPADAVAFALRIGKPTVLVAGNHEFYGGSIPGTRAQLRALCAGTPVHFLDDDAIVIDGVRFLGSTLWSDFRLAPTPEARAAAMAEARAQIRDFSRIRRDDDGPAPFTPEDSAARFDAHCRWLAATLAAAHAGPTVVVTHHAPSPSSIHPRFAGSPLNACFVSDTERLLDGRRACLWVHGHTHDSFDYTVNGTRVVCNPRGYAQGGVDENPRFDPGFIVEVGAVTPRPAP